MPQHEHNLEGLSAFYQLGHQEGAEHGIDQGYRRDDDAVTHIAPEDVPDHVTRLQNILTQHGEPGVDPSFLAFAIGQIHGATPIPSEADLEQPPQPEQQ